MERGTDQKNRKYIKKIIEMKKLGILLIMVLISSFAYSQIIGGQAFKYETITTTKRNTLSTSGGEAWVIFNETTGQFEWDSSYSSAAETWVPLLDFLPLTGGTMLGNFSAGGYEIQDVDLLVFEDIGGDGNQWGIDEVTGTYLSAGRYTFRRKYYRRTAFSNKGLCRR